MQPAPEHSDSGEVTFDVDLARLAAAFVALTILAPAAAAVLRAVLL